MKLLNKALGLLRTPVCRNWGIGSGQTDGQRAQFEQEVSMLEESIEQSGGPYLCGATPTLVRLLLYS